MKKLFICLLIGLSTVGLIGCGGDSKEVTKSSTEEVQVNDEEAKEVIKTFKQGEVAENENMKLTINKVTTSKERNQFSETKADRVVVINYTYENKTDEPLELFDSYFTAYDGDGNVLESYNVIDHKFTQSVSKGKKCTAEMLFALNSKNNKITLELNDSMIAGKPIGVWELEVK